MDDAVSYLSEWANDIERTSGPHSVDAEKLRSIAAEIATLRGAVEAERERTLVEVERHLSAVQYDPAPYTAMRAKLAAIRAQARGRE